MKTITLAKIYAILTGVLGLLSGLASLPPSDQSTLLASFVAIIPPTWRGTATAVIHFAMIASLYYTAHYAGLSSSAPPTAQTTTPPPANPPQ